MFGDLKFEWEGQKYTVEPTMELTAKVEDVIVLTELLSAMERNKPPFAKLAMAFGILLRAAGAKVADRDVYSAMFNSGEGEAAQAATSAVNALLVLMMPPEHLTPKGDEKKPPATVTKAKKARKKPTR